MLYPCDEGHESVVAIHCRAGTLLKSVSVQILGRTTGREVIVEP